MDRPRDTSRDAYDAQIEAFRRMGGKGRAAAMFRLTEFARRTAMAGIRSRHQDYDEMQVLLAYARLVLGDELVVQAWPGRDLVDP